MQVTREDLNACTIKLDVVCTPQMVNDGFNRAIRQFAKRIKVPGFRPGTAPRHLVEPMLEPEALMNQAADEIVRMSIKKVITDEKIEPADTPSVTVTKLTKEPAECEFSMKIPLKPIIELGEYKGVSAESPSIDVTEEEIEYHLNEIRKSQGKREVVTDRPAQEGDNAVINIKADGEEGDGRKFMVTIGQTFPDLDGALTGMRAEEMKSLDLNFPDSFSDKGWAGKKLHCLITIRSLNAVALPPLDDSFAQSAKGDLAALKSENLDEMKAKLKVGIENAKKQALQEYLNDQIFDELLKNSKVELPDTMWENVADQRLRELGQDLGRRSQTPEDYAKENGMTVEELVEKWRQEAKTQVQRALIVRDVFEKEKMKLTNQDLNVEVFAMAEEYQMPPAELVAQMKKNNALQELEFRAIYRKVTAFLREHADVKELEAAKA
ncbi:MAG: trigger factor [Fimbriimonadaceae bacterium]|nr:trigger factor [Fimbriimonadaceae bacterium]